MHVYIFTFLQGRRTLSVSRVEQGQVLTYFFRYFIVFRDVYSELVKGWRVFHRVTTDVRKQVNSTRRRQDFGRKSEYGFPAISFSSFQYDEHDRMDTIEF